ncbi:acetolactate synthase [Conexibacter sp. W3-3-2]|uniref:Acetolactate synthase n=1 Tax=Paraconexibacter algicola TaxID=2133960 RepID=A0A2T4UM02_9ACTN|nr:MULTISPECIES: acetolactate synthase [Solirubrobacterales]MTD46602.1 acetolactate synthase [Conexibacter sp. W3-3-2]PTL60238.1 acetolactate synthase [Paraconexibacter algicola]
MSTDTEPTTQLHGGRLVARRLKAHGVTKLFTLSGGHLFSIYDGCREEGIDLVDVRHEQAAAFAAEGWAKVTRQPGVAALTAGPGVTNGMSALGSAQMNNSPMVVLGGRAPALRWGQGSLQEIDHVPFVAPLTKFAATPQSTAEIPGLVDRALATAVAPHSGPTFVDFPLDYVFMEGDDAGVEPVTLSMADGPQPDGDAMERAIALLRGAERPVVMAGTNLYWGHGEQALLALIEELRIPTFVNGLGRGCVPADHELYFSRARGTGLKGADVALVIGVPMDFRLGFGGSFGEDTKLVVVDRAEPVRPHPRPVEAELYGGIPAILEGLRTGATGGPDRSAWVSTVRADETEKRAAEDEERNDPRGPLHPMRLYKELSEVLDRNAIIIGDGGDFVSYAGRVIDSYEPGCWLDPGPFGCLGCGPGYAIAAKVAHPDRQVVLLQGDGAFGFSAMEYDTMARLGINVVGVMGNNGIWALEKHPMEFLYGYSVAADLRPETRYDQVIEALGGHGEFVTTPEEVKPALARAFAAGRPAMVNISTDPTVVYPRKSNLA